MLYSGSLVQASQASSLIGATTNASRIKEVGGHHNGNGTPTTMAKKLIHQVTQTMDQDSSDGGIGMRNDVADLGLGLQTHSPFHI